MSWHDDRNGTFDIFGSRVSSTGTVLDPTGVEVNGSPHDQTTPAAGVNGSRYLVVWGDTRSGAGSDIYATRVSTAGAVQSPNGFPVAD